MNKKSLRISGTKGDGALEERVKQIQHPKKKNFLELWRETRGDITSCSRVVGISRHTYYSWLENDKEFAELAAECESEINDEMRQALIAKGGDGDMTAIIFWLKNRHPDFKQRPATAVNFNVFQKIDKIAKDYALEE